MAGRHGIPDPRRAAGCGRVPGAGSALRGAQNGAPETRDGIYQTARTAAKRLHDEEIMGWVTPPRSQGMPAFGADAFPASTDMLYLLTESRAAASPLIAGLTDTTLRAGRRRAERAGEARAAHGRGSRRGRQHLPHRRPARPLHPPRHPRHGPGHHPPVYQQGETVWGAKGMAALWGAATRKVIGAGVHYPAHP